MNDASPPASAIWRSQEKHLLGWPRHSSPAGSARSQEKHDERLCMYAEGGGVTMPCTSATKVSLLPLEGVKMAAATMATSSTALSRSNALEDLVSAMYV